ncbi:unnamed protein product [Urochloa humidicola]
MAHHHLRVSMISLAGFSLAVALLFTSLQTRVGGASNLGSSNKEEYVPVQSVVYRPAAAAMTESYEPFMACEGCRCCSASNASSCVETSCCYSIDCNLPGKPFGTCAFTPQSCGCGVGANNCTQLS